MDEETIDKYIKQYAENWRRAKEQGDEAYAAKTDEFVDKLLKGNVTPKERDEYRAKYEDLKEE